MEARSERGMKVLTKLGFVAVLMLFSALPSFSQDAPGRTLGLRNGRWWRGLPSEMKVGFVFGFVERRTAHVCQGDNEEWFKGGVAMGEVVDALDDFYREPANSAVLYTCLENNHYEVQRQEQRGNSTGDGNRVAGFRVQVSRTTVTFDTYGTCSRGRGKGLPAATRSRESAEDVMGCLVGVGSSAEVVEIEAVGW